MSAEFVVLYCCDCCSLPTETTHDPELVLCASCAKEAAESDLLDAAADAVDAAGERFDVELEALADSTVGLPDAGWMA